MDNPKELYYTSDHEWIRIDGNEGTIGITDYAQGELGDIVFLEFPEVGDGITQGQTFGTIEAVKAASDLLAPLTGEVMAVNGLLEQEPELINQAPFGDGWIIRIKISDPQEVETLMTAEAYDTLIKSDKGE